MFHQQKAGIAQYMGHFSSASESAANSVKIIFALNNYYYLSYERVPEAANKIIEKSVTFDIYTGT